MMMPLMIHSSVSSSNDEIMDESNEMETNIIIKIRVRSIDCVCVCVCIYNPVYVVVVVVDLSCLKFSRFFKPFFQCMCVMNIPMY